MTGQLPPALQPPPALLGQVLIGQAQIEVGNAPTGQRALIIMPAGTGLQFIVPLDDDAARVIGGALLAKHVVLPGVTP